MHTVFNYRNLPKDNRQLAYKLHNVTTFIGDRPDNNSSFSEELCAAVLFTGGGNAVTSIHIASSF